MPKRIFVNSQFLLALRMLYILAYIKKLFMFICNILPKYISKLRPAFLLKNRLWHRCFPVNFVKFLRTPFLQIFSGRLLLTFLLLEFNILILAVVLFSHKSSMTYVWLGFKFSSDHNIVIFSTQSSLQKLFFLKITIKRKIWVMTSPM